jgi:hypothetical protein
MSHEHERERACEPGAGPLTYRCCAGELELGLIRLSTPILHYLHYTSVRVAGC